MANRETKTDMIVGLQEGSSKRQRERPWIRTKPGFPPTYKEPVRIAIFLSGGGGTLVKGVDDSPDPEGFGWRIRRQSLNKHERKEIQQWTGLKCRASDQSPVRVYDDEDGPARLTKKELKERDKRENMGPGEALGASLRGWEKKHRNTLFALGHPKEWKNTGPIQALRELFGGKKFSPEEAGKVREKAMVEAAAEAAEFKAFCHPLCLFAESLKEREMREAAQAAAAKLKELLGAGRGSKDVCTKKEIKCQNRQLKQHDLADLVAEKKRENRDRDRRRKREGWRSSEDGEDREGREGREGRGGREDRESRGSRGKKRERRKGSRMSMRSSGSRSPSRRHGRSPDDGIRRSNSIYHQKCTDPSSSTLCVLPRRHQSRRDYKDRRRTADEPVLTTSQYHKKCIPKMPTSRSSRSSADY